jgi:hypothetical protein
MNKDKQDLENQIISEPNALEFDKLVLNQNINRRSSTNSQKSTSRDHKYEIITSEDSLIKLEQDFKTSDLDLKMLVNIMNDLDKNWDLILEDKVCKIQRKIVGDNPTPIARTLATVEGFTAKEIFDAIAIIKNRVEWDKNFNEFISVEQNLNEGWEVFYMSLKVRKNA